MAYRSRQYYDDRFYTKVNLQTEGQAQVHWGNLLLETSKLLDIADVDSYDSSKAGYYARIKADGSGIEWVDSSSTGNSINHNDLNGLQGGTTNEYYHLTQSEYNTLTAANSSVDDASSLHNHDSLYYTKTDADNRYVHLTGDETISGNKTFSNNVTISGDLTVNGTTTTVNSQDLLVEDNIIVLNNGETGAGVTAGTSGLQVDRGSENAAQLLFDESVDKWKVGFWDGTNGTYEFLATETWVQNNYSAQGHTHTHSDITDWDTAFSSSFDTNFGNKTTDDLSEGTTNLYFTDERAQDAVGSILTNTSSITWTYDDTNNKISTDVNVDNTTIEIDTTNNYLKVKDGVFLTTQAGSINSLTQVIPANLDILMIEDASDFWNKKKVTVNDLRIEDITSLNSATTLSESGVYIVDTSSGDVTITLPDSSSAGKFVAKIKNVGTNNVTISCQGTDTIDGSANYNLVSQYESVTIYNNGSGKFYIL